MSNPSHPPLRLGARRLTYRKNRSHARNLALFVVAALLATLLGNSAMATSDRFAVWTQTYPNSTLDSRLSCLICHTSTRPPPAWNPYGTRIRTHPNGSAVGTLASVLVAIEPEDSDEDGFTNIEEINANTAPGDAADKPSTALGKATNPSPANGAVDQPLELTLLWDAVDDAESYDVFFGAGSTEGDLQAQGNQTALSFTPENLTEDTDYVWRIDSVSGEQTTEGDLWSFRTLPPLQRPRVDNPFPDAITSGTAIIELVPLVEGLVSPLGVVPASDGTGRLFVYDQDGVVVLVHADRATTEVFLDVRDRLVPLNRGYDERGLLGFALAPDFAESGLLYTYTSEPVNGPADFSTDPALDAYNHQSVVLEWTVSAQSGNMADPDSAREMLRIDQPQGNHNGGTMMFGPDGYLYISIGDGGAADDQGPGHSEGGNGQDTGNVLGTVLRIDPTGSNSANQSYGIPADNPFVGADGIDEIFVYGLRNAFRFSFMPQTGQLILADVGQNHIEEITLAGNGDNCGWPIKEGSFYFENNGDQAGYITDQPPAGGVPAGLVDPVAEYDHDEGLSIIGGFLYGGTNPDLQGLYVFSDFGSSWTSPSGRLFTADLDSGKIHEIVIGKDNRPLGLFVKGMGIDEDGEVYVCGSSRLGPTGDTGVVLRIVPIAEPAGAETWRLY